MAEATNRLEEMIQELEESGEYVVLRRIGSFREQEVPEGATLTRGAFLDVETTGLSAERDAIIELAIVPFDYDRATGDIIRVHDAFAELNDPGRPIPRPVTALTGITDEDVQGQSIDRDAMRSVLESVSLLIAHNASFDRPFLERFDSVFAEMPWACSIDDVDWAAEGLNANKLEYLAMALGYFYRAHRAADDCLAALTVLAEQLPNSGRSGLAKLLDSARRTTFRFQAIGAPFATKDILKARGYRWNPRERFWWKDVAEADRETEQAWLAENIYESKPAPQPLRFTAMERYSGRNPA